MKDLERIENYLEKFYQEKNLLFWEYAVGGMGEDVYKEKCIKLNDERNKFFNDKEINKYLFNLWNSKNRREISLLYRYFIYESIENDPQLKGLIDESMSIIKNNLFSLDGKKITERELREKIESSKDIMEVKKKNFVLTQMQKYSKLALKIVNLRNSLARERGFNSFFEVYLFRHELKYDYISEILSLYLDSLKEYLEKIDRKKRLGEFSAMNQEIQKRLSDEEAISILKNLLGKWGIELSNNVKVIVDKEKKSPFPWNFCIPVLIPDDIRIFLYPDKSISSYYYSLFHEYGHALHYSSISEEKFIFKLNPPWYNEAMASLVDKFLSLDESINCFVNDEKVKNMVKSLNQSEDYISYLHRLTEFEFEMNLYSGRKWEEEELNEFQRKLYWKNLRIEKNSPDWAHFILHNSAEPLYGISYLLANTITNQIISYVYKKYSKYLLPQVFIFIRDNFFKIGNSIGWKEKIKKGMGSLPDISYFWGVKKNYTSL